MDARGYVIILCPAPLSRERRRRILLIAYTSVGASSLPSDIDRAMREASIRRTVTDTDSYGFFIYQLRANERMTEA